MNFLLYHYINAINQQSLKLVIEMAADENHIELLITVNNSSFFFMSNLWFKNYQISFVVFQTCYRFVLCIADSFEFEHHKERESVFIYNFSNKNN